MRAPLGLTILVASMALQANAQLSEGSLKGQLTLNLNVGNFVKARHYWDMVAAQGHDLQVVCAMSLIWGRPMMSGKGGVREKVYGIVRK
jgi:hypothetical protein